MGSLETLWTPLPRRHSTRTEPRNRRQRFLGAGQHWDHGMRWFAQPATGRAVGHCSVGACVSLRATAAGAGEEKHQKKEDTAMYWRVDVESDGGGLANDPAHSLLYGSKLDTNILLRTSGPEMQPLAQRA